MNGKHSHRLEMAPQDCFTAGPSIVREITEQSPTILSWAAKLGFLLGAGTVAPPSHGNPLWMLVDPLRDVGLRIHDALIE
jgi:hypothetical protein